MTKWKLGIGSFYSKIIFTGILGFFGLICTKKKDKMIPRWFIDWWNSYGPEVMILPHDLLKAYETFKKEPPNIPHLRDFPHLLQFFYRFPDLAWII